MKTADSAFKTNSLRSPTMAVAVTVAAHDLWRLLTLFLFLVFAWPAAASVSRFGFALAFNGTNQYVSVPNFGQIIPTNEITVEFWADANALAQQSAFMLQPDQGTNRLNGHISFNNGNTYWDFGNIQSQGRVSVPNPPNSVSNWIFYTFVASQSGNYMSIFTNGILFAHQYGMTPFARGNYDLRIGGNTNFFFNGRIDDFCVWKVARTQAQILSDVATPPVGNETNLVVCYQFNNFSGTVATNSATATGTAYNGTLVNGPAWVSSVPITLFRQTVTNTTDYGPGTLRAAIVAALPSSLITFAPNLSGQTIALNSGELVISNDLTIDASALAGGITVNGSGFNRVLEIMGGNVTLLSLTLTNGYVYGSSGGGGILVDVGAALTASDCSLSGNVAYIYQYNAPGGGGLCNLGTTTLNGCTLADNSLFPTYYSGGGGIDNDGLLTLNNCTVADNSVRSYPGGGIYNDGTAILNDCTISANSSSTAGGIYSTNVLVMTNTIVAGNTNSSGTDIFGAFSGADNLTSGDPKLAPLGNYGGLTQTMPPLAGSPAIDAGTDSVLAFLPADQRGFGRLVGSQVDIGAVELQTSLTVTTTADSGSGSLRGALGAIDPIDYISFAYNLSGQTISLTNGEMAVSNRNLTIDASALPGGVVVDARSSFRVLEVATNASVTLDSLTLMNGATHFGNGAGVLVDAGATLVASNCVLSANSATNGNGGGIDNEGSLLLDQCRLSGCSVSFGNGGGIFNGGTATLNNCLVAGSFTDYGGNGGGIYSTGGLTLVSCALSGNSANSGGGIYSTGTNTLTSCTLSGNFATSYSYGGGLYNYGVSTLYNCTVYSNSCNYGSGGGIYNSYPNFSPIILTLINCTVAGNSGYYGSGIYNANVAMLTNTIVAGNTNQPGGGDIYGYVIAGSNNLISVNALLAPFGNYGGPVQTMPPLVGSPAIDAGIDSVTSFLPTDQRGYPRLAGAHVDIGAAEMQMPVVTTSADSGAGSLREVLADAAPDSFVTFTPSLSGQTIRLTSGELAVSNSYLTLNASSLAGGVKIDAGKSSRVLEVANGNLSLVSLTLSNGFVADDGGCIRVDTGASLAVSNSMVSGSSAGNNGGAIDNEGALTLKACTISGNAALNNSGGGIYNAGIATLNTCAVSGNSAANNSGGGIYNSGVFALNASTISGNSAGSYSGGGIFNDGAFTLVNCTLAGNSAGDQGGGLFNINIAILTNCTVSANSANNDGGGIYNFISLNLVNTIVAGNQSPTSSDISGDISGQDILIGGGARLAPLGYYGGPTQTMPPAAGSPAIDAGSDAVTAFLATDQRGYPRRNGPHVDIGAVESQVAAGTPPPTLDVTSGAWGANPFQFTFGGTANADFTALASTNLSLPAAQWTILGHAVQLSPGVYQFSDPGATHFPQRYYRIVSP